MAGFQNFAVYRNIGFLGAIGIQESIHNSFDCRGFTGGAHGEDVVVKSRARSVPGTMGMGTDILY